MKMLSRREAAATLAVHPNTFDRIRRNDPTFPRPLHVGRVMRWRSDQLFNWIERQTDAG